jgi:hypothetical protein
LSVLPLVLEALKVIAGIETSYLSGRVATSIPELDLLAICQKDERVFSKLCPKEISVISGLTFAREFISRCEVSIGCCPFDRELGS